MTTPVAWPKLKRSLVAILRGLKPDETAATVGALSEAGFEAIEIPLNSPDPFRSIRIAADSAPAGVLIGAGTVLSTEDVDRLADAGGTLMVSPNVDAQVIARAIHHRMVSMPGVFTPTEALGATRAGASALKFFPASVLGPSGISAIRAVLPPDAEIGAVGCAPLAWDRASTSPA
jgi:2-dehydro-3-deoxyphosphogalactonate aldolase